MQVFEPESEVELSGGEVAGGDEAEDGILNFGRELGKGVAGAGAGDGVEFVEAELVIEGEGRRRSRGGSVAGSLGEACIQIGCEVIWIAPFEEVTSNSLEGGELRLAQILRDVEGTGVDQLLKAKAGWGLDNRPGLGEILVLGDGHDTILLRKHGLRSCTYWTLEMGGKVSFGNPRFSPKSVISV